MPTLACRVCAASSSHDRQRKRRRAFQNTTSAAWQDARCEGFGTRRRRMKHLDKTGGREVVTDCCHPRPGPCGDVVTCWIAAAARVVLRFGWFVVRVFVLLYVDLSRAQLTKADRPPCLIPSLPHHDRRGMGDELTRHDRTLSSIKLPSQQQRPASPSRRSSYTVQAAVAPLAPTST